MDYIDPACWNLKLITVFLLSLTRRKVIFIFYIAAQQEVREQMNNCVILPALDHTLDLSFPFHLCAE